MGGRKRGNENSQLSKEDYNAQEASAEGGTIHADDRLQQQPKQQRATQQQLASRRIVKVTRPRIASPPSSAKASAKAPSNPFASVTLVGTAAAAAPSASSVPSFGGGFAAPPAPLAPPATAAGALKLATSTLPPPPPPPVVHATTRSTAFARSKSKAHQELDAALKEALKWENTDRTAMILYYIKCVKAIEAKERAKNTTINTAKPRRNIPKAAPPIPAPTACAPAPPAPGVPAFAFGTNTGPTTTTTNASVSTAALDTDNTNDDKDQVVKVKDPNWDDVGTYAPVKVYCTAKKGDTGPSVLCSGTLLLQQHVSNKKSSMVMRNNQGLKVLFNVLISKDMPFSLKTQTAKKSGKEFGIITFHGTNDTERGSELFQMKSTLAVAKELHTKLEVLQKM